MKELIWYSWLVLIVAISLSGCAQPDYIIEGRRLSKIPPPHACLKQAKKYAKFLAKEGKTVKIMVNKNHAFCVMDEKIYDSTDMDYTGFSVDNWGVRRKYGDKDSWKCWKIWLGEGCSVTVPGKL